MDNQASQNQTQPSPDQTRSRKPWLVALGLLLVLLALGLITYLLLGRQPSIFVTPTPTPSSTPQPTPAKFRPIGPIGPPPFPVEEITDPTTGQPGEVAKDRLIVRFEDGVSATQRQSLWQQLGGTGEQDLGLNIFTVLFPVDLNLDALEQQLEQNPLVKYAERDGVAQIDYTPNDYSLLGNPGWWGLIDTQGAWDYGRGDRTIIVAVLDTGVSRTHPDLQGRVELFDAAIPYQGDGGHGTHVAGIAGASTDNNKGIASIGFDITIYGIQALDNSGSGSYSSITAAINKATALEADVINMSLGGPQRTQSMQDAINNAWDNNVVIVASAGNTPTTDPHYPAALDNVIAVAATQDNGSRAYFSTYGSWVEVAAPGVDILSTYYGNYAKMSGTSMASPVVAGLAALCWAAQPSLTNQQVQDFLFDHAVANDFTRHGRVDARATLEVCGQLLPTPTPRPEANVLTCYPPEWLCKDSDIPRPEEYCCEQPCNSYPPVRYSDCRTGEDRGQKDGTGQTSDYRQYPYYDYERQAVLQVPPALKSSGDGPDPSCPPGECQPLGDFNRISAATQNCNTHVTFSWEPSVNATKYIVDYMPTYKGDNDSAWIHVNVGNTTSWTGDIIYEGNAFNTPFWWRVLSMNCCNEQKRANSPETGPDRGTFVVPCP